MMSLTLTAPAKLNLFLGITPQIVEGKHRLITLFSTIGLADTLTFSYDESQSRKITLDLVSDASITALDLPLEHNIVYKALLLVEELCGRTLDGHLHIAIDKRIPSEGGLAGGSSDAAATLKFMAALWSLDPLGDVVLAAARLLGADVTFFLYGGCALMGGSGEQLIRALPQPKLDLVLVKPEGGVSTKAAYAAFDADPQPLPSVDGLVELLEDGGASTEELARAFANNLYPSACSLMPQLEALVAEIAAQPGVHAAVLTGSGSTVFGVCENAQAAKRAAQRFTEQGYWTRNCTTLSSIMSS